MEIKMSKNFKSKFKKIAQITVIEFSLLALLFSGIFIYISVEPQKTSNSFYSYNLETYLTSISKIQLVREVIVLENLSNSTITQDWTFILSAMNISFNSFELIVSNNTVSKTIVSCTSTNGKFFKSVFISSYNITEFEPKTVTLGVCN
jgi:hypothetical protein